MSFNMQAFEKACRLVGEKVDRIVLRNAIDWISSQLIIDNEEYGRGMITFRDYFEPALTEAEAEPQSHEAYVQALGFYFSAKRNERGFGKAVIPLPPAELEMPANWIREADRDHAVVRASREITATFRTNKQLGKLKWGDVYEDIDARHEHIQFPPPKLDDPSYDHAKKGALAVMNSKRKQR